MTRPQIKILGSGTSTGIPIVGCKCDVCTSSDERDQRLRTSILIESPRGKKILIDTTPDLRAQLLRERIDQIDLVIVTHEHADHIHGIDDLRPLSYFHGKDIPLFAPPKLAEQLQQRFPYIFRPHPQIIGGGIPQINLGVITEFMTPIHLEGEIFTFFMLPHGRTQTMGLLYQCGHHTFAYVIDCHEIPIEVLALLQKSNLNYLIIDCVTPHHHDTHLSKKVCFSYIEEIAPQAAGLIHMGHHLKHLPLEAECHQRFGPKVGPVYDGQVIMID